MSEGPEERPTVTNERGGGFDVEAARAIVEQRSREFEDALKRGDAAAVGEIYTLDMKIVGAYAGRENVVKDAQSMIDAGATLALRVVDLWGSGDLIVEDATIEFMDASGAVTSQGDVLLVWKREEDAWRIFRDVYKPKAE
jgi:ketosteroid isomerase-like protein